MTKAAKVAGLFSPHGEAIDICTCGGGERSSTNIKLAHAAGNQNQHLSPPRIVP